MFSLSRKSQCMMSQGRWQREQSCVVGGGSCAAMPGSQCDNDLLRQKSVWNLGHDGRACAPLFFTVACPLFTEA